MQEESWTNSDYDLEFSYIEVHEIKDTQKTNKPKYLKKKLSPKISTNPSLLGLSTVTSCSFHCTFWETVDEDEDLFKILNLRKGLTKVHNFSPSKFNLIKN